MGTRNLTMVKQNNEIKVAQYGQWDGYPSGNGIIVLDFLKTSNMDVFRERLQNVKIIDPETLKNLWVELGADPNSKLVSYEISKMFAERYPQLSRDTGAKILDIILKSRKELLIDNSLNFAKDGLFCEWAYLIDLDENKLEVYKGFNKEKLTPEDRFYFDGYVDESGYTPIKMIKIYDIDNLPTEEEFIKDLEKTDEDDE